MKHLCPIELEEGDYVSRLPDDPFLYIKDRHAVYRSALPAVKVKPPLVLARYVGTNQDILRRPEWEGVGWRELGPDLDLNLD